MTFKSFIFIMMILIIFSDEIPPNDQKVIIDNINNVDNSIKIKEKNNPRNLENENYISIYYMEDCKYSKFKNNYRTSSKIKYIIYNQERKSDEDSLIISAGTKLEIHFESQVTKLTNYFSCRPAGDYNSNKIEYIDFSHFDSSLLIDMGYLFFNCTTLKSFHFLNLNTINVVNMPQMFRHCQSLKSLDLSNLDTRNVKNTSLMFNDCINLEAVNLTNFDVSKVIIFKAMFLDCQNLKSIDLSNFRTTSAETMYEMFAGCTSLKSLDLSSFDTTNVKDMKRMFYGCNSLKSLNLSNFDTSSVTSMDNMFYNCKSLNILDISNFNILETTTAYDILSGVNNLYCINIYNTQENEYISKSQLNNENITKNTFYVCQNTNIIINSKALNSCDFDHCNIYNTIDEITTSIIESMDERNYRIVKSNNIIF